MENFSEEKLLFDIKNSDVTIENDYCPHIFDHFVNSYMNSKLKRMTTETEEASLNNKHINNKIIYFQNLSLFQNSYKSFYYYGYNQSKNLLNNFSEKYIIRLGNFE